MPFVSEIFPSLSTQVALPHPVPTTGSSRLEQASANVLLLSLEAKTYSFESMFNTLTKDAIPSFEDGLKMSFEEWIRIITLFKFSEFELVGEDWPGVVIFVHPTVRMLSFTVRIYPSFDPLTMALAFRGCVGATLEALEETYTALRFHSDALVKEVMKRPKSETVDVNTILEEAEKASEGNTRTYLAYVCLGALRSLQFNSIVHRLLTKEEIPRSSHADISEALRILFKEHPEMTVREAFLRAGI
jgi:hypothetical protein